MAPTRNEELNSSSSFEDAIPAFPSPPKPASTKSPARTPTRSPIQKPLRITQRQKQALIDNLQLEVTERARKLRAQYGLQAQSLRTRLELRINRIPMALRKTTMGDLLAKHLETSNAKAQIAIAEPKASKPGKTETVREAVPSPKLLRTRTAKEQTSPLLKRGVKRNSDAVSINDKENATNPGSTDPLPHIPKKRLKAEAKTVPNREATDPSTVLSPKSSNSRTVPALPVRPTAASPQKSYLARPISPLKPVSLPKAASPAKAAAIAATVSPADTVDNEKAKARSGVGRKAINPKVGEAATTKPAVTRPKRGRPIIAKAPQEPTNKRVLRKRV